MELTKYIILDVYGSRKGSHKAESRKDALDTYCLGMFGGIRDLIFAVTEEELNIMKVQIQKL